MGLKLIKKSVVCVLFLILVVSILFISGCVDVSTQSTNGLQIVIKDLGFPEVKYLQPTITEIQLQNEAEEWVTIWSDPAGKTFKLTPDGAETVLDVVDVPAGTYTRTKLKVSSIDVEADINRDGDTDDKNVQIILTLEEFNSLPPRKKPSAPTGGGSPPQPPEKPSAPDRSQAPTHPQKPGPPEGSNPGDPQPEKPSEPNQPSGAGGQQPPGEPSPPYTIKDGFVYMPEFLDEKHTATPPYWDGVAEHNGDYLFPLLESNFVYSGIGGKIIYDFTLHPMLQKRDQISVTVSVENAPIIINTTTENITVPEIILLDHFDGTTEGKGFGTLTYKDSQPDMDKAVNLAKDNFIKYSFIPWYKWDGTHNWNRNEAAPGTLTEGSMGMWIKPSQYSRILTFNWGDAESAPQSGYILHLVLNADGKLMYSVWGGHLDQAVIGKTTIPLNKWTHVAVSWGPKGTKLYVNGEVDASTDGNMWPAFSGTTYVYLNYWGDSDFGLVDDLRITNVAEHPMITPPIEIPDNVTENVTVDIIVNETTNVTLNITKNLTAGVIINSFTCDWTVKTGNYNVKSDCVRIIATGTAEGPVGTRVELPILSWSDDKFDCGNWTLSKGALIAVGSTCTRKEGQPEAINWTADTEGNECPIKSYFNNYRSYSVKIYKGNEIYPITGDNRTTQCQ